MMKSSRIVAVCLLPALIVSGLPGTTDAQQLELTEENVLRSLERGRKAIVNRMDPNGSWPSSQHQIGETCLATLALIYSGMPTDDPVIQRSMGFLRNCNVPTMTYEASLMLMVFAAVKDRRDRPRMVQLVTDLENSQVKNGEMKGTWSYYTGNALIDNSGDHSNAQFAVLGLFEAAHVGIPVSRQVWQAAHDHWAFCQAGNGGWGYSPNAASSGSMTAAGLSVMVMTTAMLQQTEKLDPNGNPLKETKAGFVPACCSPPNVNDSIDRAVRWMANNFAVSTNPGPGGNGWLYYYLYGLERAGRLSGWRFFGERDWYREGARYLVRAQQRNDLWGAGGGQGEVVRASFAMLFLSKGLSPVLINKLRYDSVEEQNATSKSWNWQPNDIRNLTDRITGSEGWPKLMTWQVLDFVRDPKSLELSDLNQSPILYLSGHRRPVFSERQIDLIREYISLGGFVLAVNNCHSDDFKAGIEELVERLYPNGETSLQKLQPDHPVFRAEYLLTNTSIDLWGADFGCRTAIMYSPDDIACLWNRWNRSPLLPSKNDGQKELRDQFAGRVTRALNLGTNIVTYATGREPINKLKRAELAAQEEKGFTMRRGLLQIARLRHTGGWDTAKHAARNLTMALNQTVGLTASTEPAAINPTAENLYDYSMLVMHGRQRFTLTPEERDRLKSYLDRGRLLFADACCGAPQFDQAFRTLCEQLYPGRQLERIPVDDELFQIGHTLNTVRRRRSRAAANNAIDGNVEAGPPFMEGIKINGRYVVIYSKYDISCALERQASVACTGYIPDDAVRLAVNVVLYAKLRSETLALPR